MPEPAVAHMVRIERLAHDLGGPLTVIRGVCFTLGRGESDPFRRQQLRLIDNEVQRLASGLVEIQGEGRPAASASVEVTELVRGAVRRLGPAAHRAGRRLVGTVDDPALVDGDSDRLRRALDNLVVNAIRHARSRVLVTARVSRDRPTVALLVADDGPGVDPADRHRIFRAGVRGSEARGQGRGLGLAIARDVAREHGGELDLQSSGSGACFRLRLPLQRNLSEPASAA